jgi:4-hydroxy-2-oxoheptanedioate aldolase
MGPAGFMLPWTERQEQIETLRDAVFLPPKGKRGPGGPSILANRSLDRQGWDEIEGTLFLMPQFESPAGIQHLTSLVGQEWIDATMLGPYDLSSNLNHWGQTDHPEVVAAIEQVRIESLKVGKPCGMVIGTVEQAKFWIDRGFSLFICSEVTTMVRVQTRSLIQGIRALSANA